MNNKPLAHLAILLMLAACVGVACATLYRAVQKEGARLASLEQEVATMSSDAARIAAAKEALAALAGDEASAAAFLVPAADVVPFLERLQVLGRELGAEVSIASVSKEVVDKRERIIVSLKIAGAFASVMRTLGAIEHAPYDIQTTQMSLAVSGTPPAQTWSATGIITVGTRSVSAP